MNSTSGLQSLSLSHLSLDVTDATSYSPLNASLVIVSLIPLMYLVRQL